MLITAREHSTCIRDAALAVRCGFIVICFYTLQNNLIRLERFRFWSGSGSDKLTAHIGFVCRCSLFSLVFFETRSSVRDRRRRMPLTEYY